MAERLAEDEMERITRALVAGRKIEAIKIYREATGRGLRESKDFVDALVARLIEEDPQTYGNLAKPAKVGCASVVAICLGFAAAAAWLAARSVVGG